MSGETSPESNGKIEPKNPNVITIDYKIVDPCPFPPEHSLVDAVTKMVALYNGIAADFGMTSIIGGDTVRIRVCYEGKRPVEGFSALDRFTFNGMEAISPFTNTDEVDTVGKFARVPMNSDGTYKINKLVKLQIASYSKLPLERRDTSRFDNGEIIELSSLFEGEEGQQPPL